MKKFIVGMVISIIGLYLAFRKIDLPALGDILYQTHVGWIFISISLMVFSVWIRSLRWQLILFPIKRIGISTLFSSTMIGYFGNGVLPFRLGELLRAYALNRQEEKISTASSFGTILVERLLDMMGATVVMVVVFGLYHVPTWLTKAGIIMGSIVLFSIIMLWWISLTHQDWLERIESLKLLKTGMGIRLKKLLHSFVEGLVSLRQTQHIWSLVMYTILLWVVYWIITKIAAIALDINLSWIESGIILIGTTMVISIPSSPGYIGTYHAAAVILMVNLFHHPLTESQAFAVLIHAIGFVPLVIIGFYFLVKQSIQVKEIHKIKLEINH